MGEVTRQVTLPWRRPVHRPTAPSRTEVYWPLPGTNFQDVLASILSGGGGGGGGGGGEGYTDIKNILDQILGMNDLSLEDARKSNIHTHRMKPALFSVLCEIKEKTCLRYFIKYTSKTQNTVGLISREGENQESNLVWESFVERPRSFVERPRTE